MVGEAVEQLRLLWREESVVDLVDGQLQLRIALIVLARVVAAEPENSTHTLIPSHSHTLMPSYNHTIIHVLMRDEKEGR